MLNTRHSEASELGTQMEGVEMMDLWAGGVLKPRDAVQSTAD